MLDTTWHPVQMHSLARALCLSCSDRAGGCRPTAQRNETTRFGNSRVFGKRSVNLFGLHWHSCSRCLRLRRKRTKPTVEMPVRHCSSCVALKGFSLRGFWDVRGFPFCSGKKGKPRTSPNPHSEIPLSATHQQWSWSSMKSWPLSECFRFAQWIANLHVQGMARHACWLHRIHLLHAIFTSWSPASWRVVRLHWMVNAVIKK